MTAFKQDFFTYPGDTTQPIFTVFDGAGVPINIQTVSEIRWDARRKTSDISAAITKLKSTGGVVLVGGGITGQLQVNLAGADTLLLSGIYLHQVVLTDGFGAVSTVSLGQLTVGRAPTWTYDASQLTTSTRMQVRREIGDVNYNEQQIFDEEIDYAISLRPGSVYGAAAEACRFIAANYSRLVDIVQGELKTNYSQRSKSYMTMASKFDALAAVRGPGAGAYAGGISVSDKQQNVLDTDRVQPAFARGMTDNQQISDPGPETPMFDRSPLPDF